MGAISMYLVKCDFITASPQRGRRQKGQAPAGTLAAHISSRYYGEISLHCLHTTTGPIFLGSKVKQQGLKKWLIMLKAAIQPQ